MVDGSTGSAATQFTVGHAAEGLGLALPLRRHELEALSAVAMAGAAAELISCGDVMGEASDVASLLELARSALPSDRTEEEWLLEATKTAMRMLQNHRETFDAVVMHISEGADTATCVAIAKLATDMRWYEHIARTYPHILRRDGHGP